jgi:hypothetical protein
VIRHGLIVPIGFLAAACARSAQPNLAPISNAVVDNLYVTEPAGNASLASGASGRFALQHRCLILDLGDRRVTPVFALPSRGIRVTKEGVSVGTSLYRFGDVYQFPGLGPLPPLSGMRSGCPVEAAYISAIEQPENWPKPPPVTKRPEDSTSR